MEEHSVTYFIGLNHHMLKSHVNLKMSRYKTGGPYAHRYSIGIPYKTCWSLNGNWSQSQPGRIRIVLCTFGAKSSPDDHGTTDQGRHDDKNAIAGKRPFIRGIIDKRLHRIRDGKVDPRRTDGKYNDELARYLETDRG